MNFVFTTYSRSDPSVNDIAWMTDYVTPKTTVKEFSRFLDPQFSLDTGGKFGKTVLAAVAEKGNVPLIEFIVKRGGKGLLSIACNGGFSPLHYACVCPDKEAGYLAAKKLVQLGTPINLVREGGGSTTPLEIALGKGQNPKIAVMLIKLGGIIARKENLLSHNIPETAKRATWEAAKKEFVREQEKLFLFKMGISLQNNLPSKVANHILSISAKLI